MVYMINAIKKIIDERVNVKIIKTKNDFELILKEGDPGSDIDELRITNIPEDSFAFTLDYTSTIGSRKRIRLFRKLSCYINSNNDDGVNKSCDLVIVTRINNRVNVIVLDLKSKKRQEKDQQYKLKTQYFF